MIIFKSKSFNLKILNSEQLGQVDQLSVQDQQITSWQLMERASIEATQHILKYISKHQQQIIVLAGNRNNGGDGLAIAHHLKNSGFQVDIYVFNYAPKPSSDFSKNLNRLAKTKVTNVDKNTNFPHIDKKCVVIDSIFGVGLNRRLPELVENWIAFFNATDALVFAIDVPSGLYLDRLPDEDEKVFQADKTFTFQLPKLALLFPSTARNAGDTEIVDIGLSKTAIRQIEAKDHYLTKKQIQQKLIKRDRFSHKGTFGHALLVGGSYGMNGSIRLAAEACMRSGVGKTTCKVPKSAVDILQIAVPEVMLLASEKHKYIDDTKDLSAYDSIGIGVGIGTKSKVRATFADHIQKAVKPILVDADGINCLAKDKNLLYQLPENSILTPHPGEMQRLKKLSADPFVRKKEIEAFANKYQIILVYKDAHTMITNGKQSYFNSTGNAGMATAGSGDVLTGLITGLLAQGYQPLEAATIGVYLHGLAGDFAVSKMGEHTMLSRDIISNLGEVFLKLGE